MEQKVSIEIAAKRLWSMASQGVGAAFELLRKEREDKSCDKPEAFCDQQASLTRKPLDYGCNSALARCYHRQRKVS